MQNSSNRDVTTLLEQDCSCFRKYSDFATYPKTLNQVMSSKLGKMTFISQFYRKKYTLTEKIKFLIKSSIRNSVLTSFNGLSAFEQTFPRHQLAIKKKAGMWVDNNYSNLS